MPLGINAVMTHPGLTVSVRASACVLMIRRETLHAQNVAGGCFLVVASWFYLLAEQRRTETILMTIIKLIIASTYQVLTMCQELFWVYYLCLLFESSQSFMGEEIEVWRCQVTFQGTQSLILVSWDQTMHCPPGGDKLILEKCFGAQDLFPSSSQSLARETFKFKLLSSKLEAMRLSLLPAWG